LTFGPDPPALCRGGIKNGRLASLPQRRSRVLRASAEPSPRGGGEGNGPGLVQRARRFLQAHPVVCLLILAPEVEYLTGSSQLSLLVAQPILFFLFLAQNLASYGAAVLLIREARIRWNLGWAGVLFLGACYGIINEGLGVSTLFRLGVGGVGVTGSYQHYLGVNWLNVADLIPIVHPLFSVAIPILFLDLALPETRGHPLLTSREVAIAFYALVVDTIATCFFIYRVTGFAAGPLLWGICVGTIGLLVLAARRLPKELFSPTTATPRARPLVFALIGVTFVWVLGLSQAVLVHVDAPVLLIILVVLSYASLTLFAVLRTIGRTRSEPQVVALASGLVLSLIPMGIASQLGTGAGLIPLAAGDLTAVLFVRYLWKKYRVPPESLRDPRAAAPTASPAPPGSTT
jgi:hypothetical protein